jgi:hypothetical protein
MIGGNSSCSDAQLPKRLDALPGQRGDGFRIVIGPVPLTAKNKKVFRHSNSIP